MYSRKNFSHELQPIVKQKYHKNSKQMRFSKFEQEKLVSLSNQQTRTNDFGNNCLECNYFELKNKVELPKPSQGIIIFIQNYEDLLISNKRSRQFYDLKQILVHFFSQDQALKNLSNEISSQESQQQNSNLALSIVIRPSQAIIYRLNSDPLTIRFQNNVILFHQFTSNNIPKQLELKFWLDINKKLNQIALHFGDIQSQEKIQTVLFSEKLSNSFKKQNFDWKHCQKTFDKIIDKKIQTQQQNILQNLTHFKILIKTYHKNQDSLQNKNKENYKKQKHSLRTLFNNLTINVIPLQILQNPKIQENPNLFHQSVSMISVLPSQIQVLYFRMKKMNLVNMCLEYLHFRHLKQKLDQQLIGEAIHNSVITPFGFVKNKKGHKIPVGVLNHLLYLKTNKKYQSFYPSLKQFQSPNDLYNQITVNRQGYLRFEIIHPHQYYPGNCAIIEIWPPFNCSPIHNHGQSMGMIKLLKGELRIQNYASLCCKNQKQLPYYKKDYRKGDYTWLSRDSYGIHRVINMSPSTTISLQAYYDHNQGSEEYFTFIKKKDLNEQPSKFTRYYPQHDWVNYLDMKSIQDQEDKNFIQQVIGQYELKKNYNKSQQQNLDYSFGKFIEVLLKQYYLIKSLLDEVDT